MDVQKNNNKVVGICLFIVIIILTFVYSYFVFPLYGDEIWCYGFSYNIYNGMIPYRDFSLVPTPLYFFIGSIFIKVFGEYLFSIHILNAILIGMIMIMLFKMIEWKSLLLYPLFLLFLVPTYNFLTLFFVFLVIYLISNKKDNDLILGFIVGLVFLTKQSIGIVMLIPLLFYSKKILKSICAFFIPVFILIIYLVWNDALFEFIDYCFLGMFDFNNNKVISIFTFFEIIQLVYLVVVLYKTKFRDKELFYILVYQIMSYPIFDLYHWLLSFIPFFYYIFKNFRYKEFRVSGQGWKKFIFISFILLLTFCCVFSYLGDDIFVSREDNYFYMRNVANISYDSLDKQKESVDKYINKYDESFFVIGNAYMLKLYMNIDINKYDLLFDGNMGYRGSLGYIEEINDICSNNSCVFFVEKLDFYNEYCQASEEIYNYVIENYKIVDSYDYFDVYSN